jgi:hypothetical protein
VASNSIEAKVRDLDTVGEVIDAAVEAGADSVRGIRFQVSNPDEVEADALTQAVQSARAKADALAAAGGAEVVGVVTIVEGGIHEPVYRAALPLAGYAVAEETATPIVAPEDLESQVTVTVVWEIG